MNRKKNNITILKPIKKKKKRKVTKGFVFILFFVILILMFSLPVFKVEKIIIRGNKNISTEKLEKSANKEFKNTNIFYSYFMKNRIFEKNIKKNPYFIDSKMNIKIPNEIEIEIDEVNAKYFMESSGECVIYDDEGEIVEIRENIDEIKDVIKVEVDEFIVANEYSALSFIIEAVDYSDDKSNFIINIDDNELKQREKMILSEVSRLSKYNESKLKITNIDMRDTFDMKIYFGSVEVRVGDGRERLKEKLNTSINIIIENEIENQNVYVDVSVEGRSVYYRY